MDALSTVGRRTDRGLSGPSRGDIAPAPFDASASKRIDPAKLPPARPHRTYHSDVADANPPATLRVLVYSNDADTRHQVILALGRRPHPELPPFDYVEVATAPVVLQRMDAGEVDLAILDGESAPVGGLGVAKQLKDEIENCPPLVVLTGRADDAWLASWSRAEATAAHPIDPFRLTETVVTLLRNRSAA